MRYCRRLFTDFPRRWILDLDLRRLNLRDFFLVPPIIVQFSHFLVTGESACARFDDGGWACSS